MGKTDMFSKKFGLIFFTGVFFLTLGGLSIIDANASQRSTFDEVPVIEENTPNNITTNDEIAFPKTNMVTNPSVKTTLKVNVGPKNKVYYIHVLEQGGSPSARTVKAWVTESK